MTMTYRGHFQNGRIVLDEHPHPELPNGTSVSVEVLDHPASVSPGTPKAILEVAGTWRGNGEELDQLLDDLRRDKWAEVDAER